MAIFTVEKMWKIIANVINILQVVIFIKMVSLVGHDQISLTVST